LVVLGWALLAVTAVNVLRGIGSPSAILRFPQIQAYVGGRRRTIRRKKALFSATLVDDDGR
jgi:hypothetical protein